MKIFRLVAFVSVVLAIGLTSCVGLQKFEAWLDDIDPGRPSARWLRDNKIPYSIVRVPPAQWAEITRMNGVSKEVCAFVQAPPEGRRDALELRDKSGSLTTILEGNKIVIRSVPPIFPTNRYMVDYEQICLESSLEEMRRILENRKKDVARDPPDVG